jgi:hypothetical protein
MKHRAILLMIALALQAYGCHPGSTRSSQHDTSHDWRLLYHDTTYEVALDSSHIERQSDNAYLVWYQTRHATPKVEAGQPWNRELIRSLLRCDPLSFKTVRITLHYDAGPVVAARGGDVADVASEPWKPVTSGSVDEAALREACVVISGLQEHIN